MAFVGVGMGWICRIYLVQWGTGWHDGGWVHGRHSGHHTHSWLVGGRGDMRSISQGKEPGNPNFKVCQAHVALKEGAREKLIFVISTLCRV